MFIVNIIMLIVISIIPLTMLVYVYTRANSAEYDYSVKTIFQKCYWLFHDGNFLYKIITGLILGSFIFIERLLFSAGKTEYTLFSVLTLYILIESTWRIAFYTRPIGIVIPVNHYRTTKKIVKQLSKWFYDFIYNEDKAYSYIYGWFEGNGYVCLAFRDGTTKRRIEDTFKWVRDGDKALLSDQPMWIEELQRLFGLDFSIVFLSGNVLRNIFELPFVQEDNSQVKNHNKDWTIPSEQIIKNLSERINESPQDTEAYIQRGDAYAMRNQYKQAITDYTRAIENRPNSIAVYSSRAYIYYLTDQFEHAVLDYTRIIELVSEDSEDASIHIGRRGTAHFRKGDYKHAIADFTKALETSTDDVFLAKMYLNRGATYHQRAQFDLTVSDYERTIQINSGHPVAVIARKNILRLSQKGLFNNKPELIEPCPNTLNLTL